MAKRPGRYIDELTKRGGDLLIDYGPSRLAAEVLAEIVQVVAELATPEEQSVGVIRRAGPDAAEFIEAALTRCASTVVASPTWSGAKCLYVARRLPLDMLVRTAVRSDLSDRTILSCIVGVERLLTCSFEERSTTRERELTVGGTLAFLVGDEDLLLFMRRVIGTVHLWLMQNTARVVGKGCDVVVREGGLPEAVETASLRHALDLYDQRSAHMNFVGITGTKVSHPTATRGDSTIALVGHRNPLHPPFGELRSGEVRDLLKRVSNSSHATSSRAIARSARQGEPRSRHVSQPFEMTLWDLAPLGNLTKALGPEPSEWYEPGLPGVLSLLQSVANIDDEVQRFQIEHAGYIRLTRERLFDLLAENAPAFEGLASAVLPGAEVDPRELMAQLFQLQGNLHPTVDGPVIRKAPGADLFVDLVTASRRLVWLLTMTSHGGGKRGVARGGHFEETVRSEIGRLGFGPKDPDLANLVGRQLKRGGAYITDVDAAADMGDGTVLLISVKSYPYTPDYASGRYSAVSAVTSRLLNDMVKWDAKTRELMAPAGGRPQNFNLPPASYVPVVVTPFAAYLPLPECDIEAMPGLRKACSLKELTTWLRARRRVSRGSTKT